VPSPGMTNKKNQTKTSTQVSKLGAMNTAKIKELTKRVENLTMSVKKHKTQKGDPLLGLIGKAGTALGAGISRIAGFGDYTVTDNTMSKGGYSSVDVPMFGGSGSSEVRVTHREFVKTISVPSDPTKFNNFTMDINPSNEEMFPWLSKIAKNYQQYKINGMVVTFKSMTSEYTSAGALGTVGIATNYNVNDKPYADLVSFENSQFAVVNKPSLNIVHAIECKEFARNGLQLYVRDAGSESTQVSDSRFYDFAKVQIMTDGLPQAVDTTLGQLWVSYDITLLKPVVPRSSVVPPSVPRTILTSQRDTAALQMLANGDIYADDVSWPDQVLAASSNFRSFSTIPGLDITSAKSDTFSRNPTELTLISPSEDGGLLLRRNGRYVLIFSALGEFPQNANYVTGESVMKDFAVTTIGTAVSNVVYDLPYTVKHNVYGTSGVRIVNIANGALEIEVSGITFQGSLPTGGVQIDINDWKVWNNQTMLPSKVSHTLHVQWSDHVIYP